MSVAGATVTAMTTIEPVSSVTLPDGSVLERLVAHPRLPLVAGLEAARPAVQVWGWASGVLAHVATVGEDAAPYGDAFGWDRMRATPSVAWHPERDLLAVSSADGVVLWEAGACTTPMWDVPEADRDSNGCQVAFAGDGTTVLLSNGTSVAVDLVTGTVRPAVYWDTGVAVWPGGGLALSYASDQGATHGLFTRPSSDGEADGGPVLDRALLLDVDGYETPVVSPDGRYFAVRGNAYTQTLQVFEMPGLRLVLSTALVEDSPGYPYPPEWLAELESWSRHNIAFGDPGTLWVGTPHGTLVGLDVTGTEGTVCRLPDGGPVTALTGGTGGLLVVATGTGGLHLVSDGSHREAASSWGEDAAAVVQSFLATCDDVPAAPDTDVYEILPLLTTTDGVDVWRPGDLDEVTDVDESGPTWLQIRAFMNKAAPR